MREQKTKYYLMNDFSVGEVSPEFYGRDDTPLYRRGVQKASNMYPLASGAMKAREGSKLLYADKRPFISILTGSGIDYLIVLEKTFLVIGFDGEVLIKETDIMNASLRELGVEITDFVKTLLTASIFFYKKVLYLGTKTGLFKFTYNLNLHDTTGKFEKIVLAGEKPEGVGDDFEISTAYFDRVLVGKDNVLHFSSVQKDDKIDFTTGTTALKGFNIPFNFGKNESVQWIQTGYKYLYVGTTYGVYIITGTTRDLPPSPSAGTGSAELGYVVRKIDTHGRSTVGSNVAVSMANSLYFASDKAIYRVQTLTAETEIAEHISPLAKHIFDSKITALQTDVRVDGRIFVLLENGKLVLLNVGNEEQGVGFVQHELNNDDKYFFLASDATIVSLRNLTKNTTMFCLERFFYWNFRERQGDNFSQFDIFKSESYRDCVYLDCAQNLIEFYDGGYDFYASINANGRIDMRRDVASGSDRWERFHREREKFLRDHYRFVSWKNQAGKELVGFWSEGGWNSISDGSWFAFLGVEFQGEINEDDLPVEGGIMKVLYVIKRSIFSNTDMSLVRDFKKVETIAIPSNGVLVNWQDFTDAKMVYYGIPYKASLSLLAFAGSGRLSGGVYNLAKANVFRSCSFLMALQERSKTKQRSVEIPEFFTGVVDCNVLTRSPDSFMDNIYIEAEIGRPLMILSILIQRTEGDF